VNFQLSIIIAEFLQPEVAICFKILRHFCVLLEEWPLMAKFIKILFRKFSSWHRLMCCVQILWNLDDGKWVKSCFAYVTKKKFRMAVTSTRMAPKIFQDQPPTMYSRVLQIVSISVHCRRRYSRMREGHQNAP